MKNGNILTNSQNPHLRRHRHQHRSITKQCWWPSQCQVLPLILLLLQFCYWERCCMVVAAEFRVRSSSTIISGEDGLLVTKGYPGGGRANEKHSLRSFQVNPKESSNKRYDGLQYGTRRATVSSSSVDASEGGETLPNGIGDGNDGMIASTARSHRMIESITLVDNTMIDINLPSPRIVGGQDADEDEYDAYVQLLGLALCGASLIAPSVVLTAAHCWNPLLQYVSVNTWELNPVVGVERGDAQHVPISRIERHPRYGIEYFADYDFMLLELSESITNVRVMTVNNDESRPRVGEDYVVIGLGRTDASDSSSISEVLQELSVQMVDMEVCNGLDLFGGFVNEESMFCAAVPGLPEGQDPCLGDSGGPLFYVDRTNNDEQIQLGLVSWGRPICAQEGESTVYARVSTAYDWIQEIVCDAWGNDNAPFCNSGNTDDEGNNNTTTTDDSINTPDDDGEETEETTAPDDGVQCVFGAETLLRFQITTDRNGYGSDLFWDLRDDGDNVIDGDDGFEDEETRIYELCLSSAAPCYVLTIYDRDENNPGFCCDGTLDSANQCCDGIEAGVAILFGSGSLVDFENPTFMDSSISFFLCQPDATAPEDDAANDTTEQEEEDENPGDDGDGDETSITNAPANDPPTSAPATGENDESSNGDSNNSTVCREIIIDLRTDSHPNETSVFMFRHDDYEILLHQFGGFSRGMTDYTFTVCFTGCLVFGLLDDGRRNGLSPPAGVNITDDGEMVVTDLSNFTKGAVVMVGRTCPEQPSSSESSTNRTTLSSSTVSTYQSNVTNGNSTTGNATGNNDGEDNSCEQFDLVFHATNKSSSSSSSSSNPIDISMFILVGGQYNIAMHRRMMLNGSVVVEGDPEEEGKEEISSSYTACLVGCLTVGIFNTKGASTNRTSGGVFNVTYGNATLEVDADFGSIGGIVFPIGKDC